MERKFDIIKILRTVAMFSLVFLLFACGNNNDVNTAVNTGNGEPTSTEQIVAENNDCWAAAIVGTIYETTGRLAMSMYSHLTQGAMALMMVAFAVWLSFRIIKHVSSFAEESPAEVWTEVARKFFVCFVCGLLASSPEGVLFVLNSIIFPVYNAFLELGSAMTGASIHKDMGSSLSSIFNRILGVSGAEFDVPVDCKADVLGKAELSGGFPSGPQKMMECLTCAVNKKLNLGIGLGWEVITQFGVMAFVCGLLLVVVFCLVKLGFSLYLIDSIFRFAMMVIILPLLIMSYAFKATKNWAKIGFLTILNSGAFMMCIALVMMIIFGTIDRVITEEQAAFADKDSLADVSVPFIILLLIAFLTVKSLKVAQEIVNKLVGGGGEANFQKQAGTLAATLIRGAVIYVSGGAGKFLLDNSKKLRNFQSKVNNAQGFLNDLAGRKK